MAMALVCGVACAAETESIGPLMETARIEGQAHGTLGGETAARMAAMGIPQPVEVSVTRLYRLRDSACARLKVSFDQKNVLLPGETTPRDRHAEFAMNWCEGGRPPSSEEGARPIDAKEDK
jgi:hypothetical protein